MSPARPRLGICAFAPSLGAMADVAADAGARGWDSVWTSELYNRSATVTLAASRCAPRAARSPRGSSMSVGRSPLMLAAEAREADELSGGRFVLGIGNGTRRMISDWYGQDGSGPASRMEELIPLLRRIWALDEGRSTTRAAFAG